MFTNVADAIREANTQATQSRLPVGIAYVQGKGWATYEPQMGTIDEAEFLCMGQGRMPLPLSDTAAQVLFSLVRSLI